jgi:hypothetical protein
MAREAPRPLPLRRLLFVGGRGPVRAVRLEALESWRDYMVKILRGGGRAPRRELRNGRRDGCSGLSAWKLLCSCKRKIYLIF